MGKRLITGLVAGIIVSALMDVLFRMTHPEATSQFPFPAGILFYAIYIVPPFIIGGCLISYITDLVIRAINTVKYFYFSNLLIYASLGALSGFVYVYVVLGGREQLMWLYGLAASLFYYHVLLLVRFLRGGQ